MTFLEEIKVTNSDDFLNNIKKLSIESLGYESNNFIISYYQGIVEILKTEIRVRDEYYDSIS